MYKSKDFIKRPSKEDIQIWDSTDKKYYISTALIDGAKFYLYDYNIMFLSKPRITSLFYKID